MKGTGLIYRADSTIPEVISFDKRVDLATIQEVVDGFIEAVPHFKTIGHNGTTVDCVAFCNEDGKAKNLPLNRMATLLWIKVRPPEFNDVLVGDVMIVFGDDEFMEEL
jgi:hypothetical protein